MMLSTNFARRTAPTQWKPTRSFTAREIEVKKKRLDQMVAARSQLNEAKARQEKQEEMNHMVSHALKEFEKERRARESGYSLQFRDRRADRSDFLMQILHLTISNCFSVGAGM